MTLNCSTLLTSFSQLPSEAINFEHPCNLTSNSIEDMSETFFNVTKEDTKTRVKATWLRKDPTYYKYVIFLKGFKSGFCAYGSQKGFLVSKLKN